MSKRICFMPSSLHPYCLIVSSRGAFSTQACVFVCSGDMIMVRMLF